MVSLMVDVMRIGERYRLTTVDLMILQSHDETISVMSCEMYVLFSQKGW
jgi:hypothetical protein